MVKFSTYFETARTLEGKLNSEVTLAVWELDEKTQEFSSQGSIVMKIPRIIPTPLSWNINTSEVQTAFKDYKTSAKEKYELLMKQTEKKLSGLQEKREKAEAAGRKVSSKVIEDIETLSGREKAIKTFLENIDAEIRLEGPFAVRKNRNKTNYNFYHFITPPLGEDLQKKLNNTIYKYRFPGNNKYTRQIARDLNFPFNIIEPGREQENSFSTFFSAGTRLETEKLLQARRASFDIETHNYEHIVTHDDKSVLLRDLNARLSGISEESGIKLKKKLNRRSRQEVLNEMDRILNIQRNEIVTTVVISDVNTENNYLVTIFPSKEKYVDVPIPGKDGTKRFKILTADSQWDLADKINQTIKEIDPFYMQGNYQITFDYRKVEKVTENMNSGTIEGRPKFRGQIPPPKGSLSKPYVQQYINKGRIDIDNSLYMRTSDKLTRNNKLDTILSFILGLRSKKTLNYAQLKDETDKAQEGIESSIHEILYYTAQDGMKSNMMGDSFIEEHLLLAKAFNSFPSRIDATSKGSLAEDYWVNRFFEKNKTYPFFNMQFLEFSVKELTKGNKVKGSEKELSKGNKSKDDKTFVFEDFSPNSFIPERFPLNDVKKGLTEGYIVELFPLAKAFEHLLKQDPDIRELYDYVRRTSPEDAGRKARMLRMIESLGKYPLALMYSAGDRITGRKRFMYKLPEFVEEKNDVLNGNYRQRLESIMEDISKIYESNLVLNANNETLLLSINTPDEHLESLKNFGVIRGKGLFLSVERGRIAGNINGDLLLIGIADYDSKRGERCGYERQFTEEFLHRLLVEKNPDSAREYAEEQVRLFNERKINPTLLEFEKTATKDYSKKQKKTAKDIAKDVVKDTGNTSDPEDMEENYRSKLKKAGARQGEKIRYSYTHEKLCEKFFGLKLQNKRNQLTLFSDSTVNKGENMGGTLGELVSLVYKPSNNVLL